MLTLLPKLKDADALPPATARSCLPYWLEAVGWAAALMSDAAAAAMGRLPAAERDKHSVHTLSQVGLSICSDVAVTTVTSWYFIPQVGAGMVVQVCVLQLQSRV